MISQDAKNVMAVMARMKVPNIHELPIELCRKGMENMMSFSRLPTGCRVEKVNAGGPEALWVDASKNNGTATILYLHGGGYTMGSAQTHAAVAGAYRWLLKQGVPAKSIVIGGDSAGGGLAFAAMLELKREGYPLPAAAFALSPWVDLANTGDTVVTKDEVDPIITRSGLFHMASLYAKDADLRSPLISPLYGDLSGLPPVLIHVGTNEMLLADSRRMAEALKRAGVDCEFKEWEDLFHVFHNVLSLPESKKARGELAAFIGKHIYKG